MGLTLCQQHLCRSYSLLIRKMTIPSWGCAWGAGRNLPMDGSESHPPQSLSWPEYDTLQGDKTMA